MQSNNQDVQDVINEMIKSFNYLVEQMMKNTTKCYDAIIVSSNIDGTWNLKFNGETHGLPSYGSIIPSIGKSCKVLIPQGNLNLAYFF